MGSDLDRRDSTEVVFVHSDHNLPEHLPVPLGNDEAVMHGQGRDASDNHHLSKDALRQLAVEALKAETLA